MSTQHHLMGSINHYSQESVYNHSRQYPSPHHSPSLDVGKPVVNHGGRWESESPTPAYSMASATPVSWGNYLKQQSQQRLPPTPPMHTHLGDYSNFPSPTPSHDYGTADYQDHGLSMAPTPLSPPVSEGFMSPGLTNQDSNQAWFHSYGVKSEASNMSLIDSPSLLGINAYNTGNITAMQQTQAIAEEKRKAVEGLFADVSGGQAQRKKRRLTEPGEANYHCQTCGKYFSRVWNYNAHRETHDPTRPKPHICTEPNCGKAFVRRTDLTRHVQCVHAKDKKFKCRLCNNRFARKDTLRRHEDDGCPKRVDIQSRNNKGSSPIPWTSWALRCPPPPEYFTFTYSKPQHQQQPIFDNGTSVSFLPPLSIALSGSQAQQGGMIMP